MPVLSSLQTCIPDVLQTYHKSGWKFKMEKWKLTIKKVNILLRTDGYENNIKYL